MATEVGRGTNSHVRYAYEAVFGTAEADANISGMFGHGVTFSATARNNTERIANLNTRDYTKYAAKKFEGTFTVDFQLSNAFFLKGAVGNATTTGSDPYTHTYDSSLTKGLSGATIQSSENLDTDSERTFTGCLFNNTTLTMNVGDVVTGRIDGLYAKEAKDSTLNTTWETPDTEDVFTFAEATLEIPNATAKLEVQNVELSIANNVEMLWGLGSRIATKGVPKQRAYEVRMSRIREADADVLDLFYGNTTTLTDPSGAANTATLEITLDNEQATTAQRKIVILLDQIQFEDYNAPITVAELTKESVTAYALSGTTFTYLDSTQIHP